MSSSAGSVITSCVSFPDSASRPNPSCGGDIDAGGNRGLIAETGCRERAHEAADAEERGLLICLAFGPEIVADLREREIAITEVKTL